MSHPPIAYRIEHEGLFLDISLIETDKLLIHEEIIPYRLDRLKRRIERDGVQSAPILIDRRTNVVLDGKHRTAIMNSLDCRFTCVCLLDYFDPSINVQRWCRVIPGPFSKERARDYLASLDLKMEPYEVLMSPDEDDGLLVVFRDKAFKVVSDIEDILELFKKSYELEVNLEEHGYEVVHCTESQALNHMLSGYEATIYMPKVRKEQIIEVASRRQVFTPKATRHKLPARPLGVNVPLNLLRDNDISLEEAIKQLALHLNYKQMKRHDQGAEWMGRMYDEVLYVFSDP